MSTKDVSRRRFMLTASGAALAAGATAAGQPVAAQEDDEEDAEDDEEEEEEAEGEEEEEEEAEDEDDENGDDDGNEVPDFGEYLQDANGFEEAAIQDARGEDEITINVGAGSDGYAYDPAGVWVDPGTTITWEWTGEGGGHDIAINDGPGGFEYDDIVDEEGHTHEYEVVEDDEGITTYKCTPHEGQGMKAGVAVGDDVDTIEVEDEGAAGPDIVIPDEALSLTVATFIAMGSTLGLGYFLMKFGGDYEQQ